MNENDTKENLIDINKRLAKLSEELLTVDFEIYETLHENEKRNILEESWYLGLHKILIVESENALSTFRSLGDESTITLMIKNAKLEKLNSELLLVSFEIFQTLYDAQKRNDLEEYWYKILHELLIIKSRNPLD